MFGELPKLLDRNFALGHFLPAVLFLGSSACLLAVHGFLPASFVETLTAENPWLGVSLAAAVTWLFGVALLGANRLLIRGKEGYGLLNRDWNPFKKIERWRFRRLQRKLDEAKRRRRKLRAGGREVPDQVRTELTLLAQSLAVRYPNEERLLLPTAFGNTLRSFEVYSLVMYGAEATEIWERLLTVVPKEYRDLMDLTKTQMDFWVNLWWLSIAILVEIVTLAWLAGSWKVSWIVLLAVLIGIPVASYQARRLAQQWGKTVKACFDVFLPELHQKLGLPQVASREKEHEQWTRFSQAVLFRRPKLLPEKVVPDGQAVKEAPQSAGVPDIPQQATEPEPHRRAPEASQPWFLLGQLAVALVIWLWTRWLVSSSDR